MPRLELSQTARPFSIDASSARMGHHTLDSTLVSDHIAATLAVFEPQSFGYEETTGLLARGGRPANRAAGRAEVFVKGGR